MMVFRQFNHLQHQFQLNEAKTIDESDWYSINIYQKNTQAEIAYLTTELYEIINEMLKVGDIRIIIKNTLDKTNEKTN
tara:strand:+ start:740 stop:973 length:234 start_codon:yes stop_codon:yes gene_type:complete